MPAGTKIGGVNPATVKIVSTVDNSGNLPDTVYYIIGDGIITEDTGNLHVVSENLSGIKVWSNVGSFRGPIGNQGFTGYGAQAIKIYRFSDLQVMGLRIHSYGSRILGIGYTGFQGIRTSRSKRISS